MPEQPSFATNRPNTPPQQVVASPLPSMPAYYNNAKEKSEFIASMFDDTAADYDRMERLLGLGSGPWYRGQALLRAGLEPGKSVIDVAVGTGLVACEAVRIVGDPTLVTGVDPSPGMLSS